MRAWTASAFASWRLKLGGAAERFAIEASYIVTDRADAGPSKLKLKISGASYRVKLPKTITIIFSRTDILNVLRCLQCAVLVTKGGQWEEAQETRREMVAYRRRPFSADMS